MHTLRFDLKKAEVLKLLRGNDKTGQEFMNFEDFTIAMSKQILACNPNKEIWWAFHLFDDDNTGRISLKNLRQVAKEIGDR
ncbi:Calcium-binding component of the spindle pole body (SPB) half-bridge [Marasmius crinis-equi]|uniref:Calcium-binding component of the spindle pole body (SPB) half-bridge n=1 Tax=Marasmius crinis-equi TaxID=585013 RepID=A0ABR3FB71_9AGAR